MKGRLAFYIALQLVAGAAYACRFAADAKPPHWYEWSSALFAADVANVHTDREKALDLISVRVLETFKGPAAVSATLQVPSRMWDSCRLERPAAGARVLVAFNPNGDTLVVPLTASYAELLRAHRSAEQRRE